MAKADVITLEGIMFHTKSRTEQLQDQADSLACSAGTVADHLRERVIPAVGQATDSAREWARPHVDRGIEVAAPRLESAVSGLAPKVDTARDKLVEDIIPRVAEAISVWAVASAAARDEALSRGQGAASVISGDSVATPKHKKKRVLLALGLLAAAGAAAMTVMKKSAPKDDPWTTPLADPGLATSNGRHSAAARVDETATTTESEILDALADTGATPRSPAGGPSLTVNDSAEADVNDKNPRGNNAPKDGSHKNGTGENPPA
jgi:hypothetical protein